MSRHHLFRVIKREPSRPPTITRASRLEVTVTYEGKVLDASRVVLHRSPDRIAPPDDDASCQAGDRPAVPGEFLG